MPAESFTPSHNTLQQPNARSPEEILAEIGVNPKILAAHGITLERGADLRQAGPTTLDPHNAVDLDGNGLIAVVNVAETPNTPGTLVKVYGIKNAQGQFNPNVVVLGGINTAPHHDSKNNVAAAFGFVSLSKNQGLTQFGRELPGANRLGLAGNPRVSRVHFSVMPTESGFILNDSGSLNGTTVITGQRAELEGFSDHVAAKQVVEPEARQHEGRLAAYIDQGLELIRQGKFEDAQTHFRDSGQARDLGVNLSSGRSRPVNRLMTDEDVIREAREVGANSWHTYGTVMIGEYYPITSTTFEEHPELYDPKFVHKFKYEMALTHAEEWLHDLQDKSGKPLTENAADDEADVAAYFYKHGLTLSADFLTRYKSRMDWYLKLYPERADELQHFREIWDMGSFQL